MTGKESKPVDLTPDERREALEVMLAVYRPHPTLGSAHRQWMEETLERVVTMGEEFVLMEPL